ncbi:oligosaccharide flippase family protein [Alicyclobacillus herbarius]|uniref:oligosaccharide flippase family protein n=1 Tax=Alicyclobacillus herbarius TaxID=122960 RepID=UPI0004025C8E|nr:oligosaccharide flippase family protein [Alicyclobacillus herbarius]
MRGAGNATRRVFFNSTALTAMKMLGLLISFFVTPITIHQLGMADYGLWAILSGMVSYFTLLDFGTGSTFMTQFALFYAADNRQRIREVMTFGIVFYLGLGILMVPVAWLVASHLVRWFHVSAAESSMVVRVFWYTYAYLFVSRALGGFGTLLNAAQKMVFMSALGFACQGLNSAVLLIALVLHLSLDSFVIANYLSLIVSIVVTVVAARRLVRGRLTCAPWHIRGDTVKGLLSFGGWMQLTNLANQVNMETDRILIGHFVGAGATGVYQLGNKLALMSRYLPLTMLSAMLPAISEQYATHSEHKIRSSYIEGTRWLALVTFLVSGFLISANDPLQVLWLGHSIPSLSFMTEALLVGYVTNNLTGVGTTILRAVGTPRLEAYYMVVGAVLNILLTVVLAPRFGVWGILWGTALGMTLSSWYFLFAFHRYLNIRWWSEFLRYIVELAIAAVGAGLPTYEISRTIGELPNRILALTAVFGLGAFFTLTFLFLVTVLRFFQPRDVERLKRLVPFRFVDSRWSRLLLDVADRMVR